MYVFVRQGATWAQQARLSALDGAAGDRFGAAVALSGDTLVVGAYSDDLGANEDKVRLTSSRAMGRPGRSNRNSPPATARRMIASAPRSRSAATRWRSERERHIGANIQQGSVYVFVSPACPALTLAPASLPDGASGTSYQQQMTVSGGAGPFQFALAGGALPPGLNAGAKRLAVGHADDAGHLSIHDPRDRLEQLLCRRPRLHPHDCAALLQAPVIRRTLPNGKTGAAYSETLAVKGGAAPYNCGVAGALPPG